MGTKIAPIYSGSMNTISITLASLATGSARQSAFIDNTPNFFVDAAIYFSFRLVTGAPTGDKVVNVYLYSSIDNVNYTDNATGADAAITIRTPPNLKLLGTVNTPDDLAGAANWNATFESVAPHFGGILPPRWGIVVENQTGRAFTATEANHTKSYRGINPQMLTF